MTLYDFLEAEKAAGVRCKYILYARKLYTDRYEQITMPLSYGDLDACFGCGTDHCFFDREIKAARNDDRTDLTHLYLLAWISG